MISQAQLAEAYRSLGFVQEDEHTFVRASDSLMMFHHPYQGKIGPLWVIISDARLGGGDDFANQLLEAIEQVLTSDG